MFHHRSKYSDFHGHQSSLNLKRRVKYTILFMQGINNKIVF